MTSIVVLSLILTGAIVLFVTEWIRVDLVALLILATLVISGILTPEEALLGFSNPATVTVACMFVLSAALARSGALDPVSYWIARGGRGRPIALLALLILAAGPVSAFINNTAVVAIFLPATTAIARREGVSVSKLLIPMAFSTQFGGVCTLIGTSTNLVVSAIASDAGLPAFRMFEFAPLGVTLFVVGAVLLLTVSYRLLPARQVAGETIDQYELRDYLAEVEVLADSPLVGHSPDDPEVESALGLDLLGIIRGERRILAPLRSDTILAGDLLLVEGTAERLMQLRRARGLRLRGDLVFHDADLTSDDVTLFEALVVPGSRLGGRSLKEVDFRRRYGLNGLAIRRTGESLRMKVGHVRLRIGDLLLLQGRPRDIEGLKAHNDLLVLGPIGARTPRRRRLPVAALIMAGVVAAAVAGVPIMASAFVGGVLVVLTRCLTLDEAYEAIDWKILFLLAGVLPLGTAMRVTGAADLIAREVLLPAAVWGPIAVLAALYLVTTLLTEVMSNNAAAAVLAPIGIAVAHALGVDPKPFLMAVCFAGSTSFLTPIGYQTNTMVYAPGAYRFWDFARAGWAINLAFWIVSVLLIPLLWPFG